MGAVTSKREEHEEVRLCRETSLFPSEQQNFIVRVHAAALRGCHVEPCQRCAPTFVPSIRAREQLLEKEDGGDREECAIAHRPYASPTVRKKRREAKRKGAQPPRTAPQGAPGDAVDKYDYLIVFKKVSSVTARVVDEESGGSNEVSIK